MDFSRPIPSRLPTRPQNPVMRKTAAHHPANAVPKTATPNAGITSDAKSRPATADAVVQRCCVVVHARRIKLVCTIRAAIFQRRFISFQPLEVHKIMPLHLNGSNRNSGASDAARETKDHLESDIGSGSRPTRRSRGKAQSTRRGKRSPCSFEKSASDIPRSLYDPSCNIKGNICQSNEGEKIYHVPGQHYYYDTRISYLDGERYFCSEEEALTVG